jgi:hypothetical protein
VRASRSGPLSGMFLSDGLEIKRLIFDMNSRGGVQWANKAVVPQAIIAVAIRRYYDTFGTVPSRLNDLVEEFLSEIPDDPFSDGPMIYETTDEGFRLTSVGQDGELSTISADDLPDDPRGEMRAALYEYHLDHAEYPRDLDALIPDYLSEISVEPFTGGSLKYTENEEGGFDLDLIDGGGNTVGWETWDDGDDYVWVGRLSKE